MFNHLPSGWIKVPDGAVTVPRVPYLAVAVDQQTMRLYPCRQVPLVKCLRVGIEARDLVPVHDRNIDVAIGARRRIAANLGVGTCHSLIFPSTCGRLPGVMP